MPVTFDPVGDFIAVCDGLQAVTLTDRDDANADAVADALRRAVTLREAERSNGLYTTSDVHWHLPQSQVTTDPQPGYIITDSNDDEWTILAVEDQTLTDRWRCTCRNLVVAEQLDTLVTIQVSTSIKGDTGAHEQTWADQQGGIRARIQRIAGQVRTTVGASQIDATHTMYFRESIVLTARHRVADSDGNRYRVVGYRDPERIDKLCEADLVPWTDDYLSGEIQ
jgi:head-tail adaptor